MCGLFGVYVKDINLVTPEDRMKLFYTLGRKSETRGKDSWGVMLRWNETIEDKQKGYYKIHKGTGPFVETKKKEALITSMPLCHILLGHTRQGTHGKVCSENAHPFETPKFISAHNGMLFNDDKYMKETLLLPDGDTDSETFMCWVDSKIGNVEGFLKADESQAFWIYEKQSDTVYLCSTGGPLWYINTPALFCFSSESIITETSYQALFSKKEDAKSVECISKSKLFKLTKDTGLKFVKEAKQNSKYLPYHGNQRFYRGRWQNV